ncbi:MAG: HDOD domain-containing protein [Planctomycetota bacterium]
MPELTTNSQAATGFRFEIPRFSSTASQLVERLNDEEVKVCEVIQLIECEPTIGSQILSLANSPVFGASRVVSTIGQAIVVLGFRCVAQQAIAASSGALFKSGDEKSARHRTKTYVQSLGTAAVARRLASTTNDADPDEFFLVGIVHDIGKLVLLHHAGEDYTEVLDRYPTEEAIAREMELFGINHMVLGRQCGAAWSLPQHMCASIEDHHLTLDEVSSPLTRTIVGASYLAKKWELGFEHEDFIEEDLCETELDDIQSPDLETLCREDFETLRDICC